MNASALLYLNAVKMKNRLKSIIKKPVQLVYFFIVLVLLSTSVFGGRASAMQGGHVFRDTRELGAIVTLLYAVLFLMTARNGFDRGGSMFTMPDVNLLFVAPIGPRRLLFYGLLRQMTTSLLLGFFLLFQYATLHRVYGITYGRLILLVVCYAATIFLGQLTAVVLYAFTSADERRKRACKTVFYLLTAAYAAAVGMLCLPGGREGLLSRAVEAVCSVGAFFPAAGWLGMVYGGILTGSVSGLLWGAGLSAAYFTLLVTVLLIVNSDYYEDVLGSAEAVQSAITAKKEGALAEAAPRHVRLGKTGLRGGWGAQAFYYKHRLENRRSRVFLLSPTSLIFAAVVIFFAAFTKKLGIIATFSMSTYMQIFSVMLGRLNRELTKPYIYLIPEPPLKKLLWAVAELLPSSAAESVLVFVPVGFLLGLGPVNTVLCMLARLSFALLFTAGNVAVERLWGGVTNRMVVVFLYFFTLLLMAVPGVILAVVFYTLFHGLTQAFLLAFVAANIPVSVLVLYLCRDMLEFAELNNV